MKTLRILYHLALADFYERVRNYRFLLIMAVVIYVGVLVNNGTLLMHLGPVTASSSGFRGEYNSAWIGTMIVLVINTFLGLIGFFLVSDCIKRDIRTGVGQIIATTPISRAIYLCGKWISNFLVLSVLVVILAAAAAIMVLLKNEAALDLGALLMPFIAVTLPCMALIAALAVVFESIPWLRGTMGNIAYFSLWLLALTYFYMWSMELPLLKDPIGYNLFDKSLFLAAGAAYPNDTIGGMCIGIYSSNGAPFKIFNWPGLAWTPGTVSRQWLWAVLGLALTLLAATWFTRFDPSRERSRQATGKPGRAAKTKSAAKRIKIPRIALPNLSPYVSKLAQLNPFLGVLLAELRMLIDGRRWWWWVITVGLNLAILVNPLSATKEYLLPIAWLLPLAVWSEMGNRERKNNTSQMVFSSARPVLRQLPAAWLAGVMATALFGIAGAVVFLANGDLAGLAGWAGAVIFIPTLALSLGILSSGSRLFELVYLIWWYLGPMQKTPGLDFIFDAPQAYLTAAAGLLLLSALWRAKQVRI